ncbi:MAG TPA: hypothetical protein ENN66_10255 [Proteobacteria bacterium]|nr:hypothetical protein [Pseudomonadota bacterium]
MTGVTFVAMRLYGYAGQIDISVFSFSKCLFLCMLAAASGLIDIINASSWWHLLSFLGVKTDWRWALRVYGIAGLGKYIPGNIFHLAGRQAMGMAAGLPARPFINSMMWELGLKVVCGVIFGFLVVPLRWPTFSSWSALILFLLIVGTLFTVSRRLFSPLIARAFLLQIVFLGFSGWVFVWVMSLVASSSVSWSCFPGLGGAYVLAWLAGLLTPGAPAGVGVRELVLLFLLAGQIAPAELLLAVVLGRVVTVFGNLFYFMIATLLLKSGDSG